MSIIRKPLACPSAPPTHHGEPSDLQRDPCGSPRKSIANTERSQGSLALLSSALENAGCARMKLNP